MKKRTLAIAGTLAALTLTAAPIAAATASAGHTTPRSDRIETTTDRTAEHNLTSRSDRSLDRSTRSGHDISSVDRTRDR